MKIGRQRAVDRGQTRSHSRRAFTLAELIVVMGLIVLLITLAVPAIRAMTGTKSEEAARNTLSAFLGRVRTEAIGLQQTQGVLFFIDPTSDRVACLQVKVAPSIPANHDLPGAIYLDAVPDRDPLYLPSGVRLQTLKDPTTVRFPKERYLGYDPLANAGVDTGTMKPVAVGGVILFDGTGRVITVQYGFRGHDPSIAGGGLTPMGQLLHLTQDAPTNGNLVLPSQLGFVLYDKDTYQTSFATANDPAGDNDGAPNETMKEQWLDNNATPILINRNNGTLIRAE